MIVLFRWKSCPYVPLRVRVPLVERECPRQHWTAANVGQITSEVGSLYHPNGSWLSGLRLVSTSFTLSGWACPSYKRFLKKKNKKQKTREIDFVKTGRRSYGYGSNPVAASDLLHCLNISVWCTQPQTDYILPHRAITEWYWEIILWYSSADFSHKQQSTS